MVNSLLVACARVMRLVWVTIAGPMAAWFENVRRRMARAGLLRIFFLAGLNRAVQIVMVPLLKEFRLIGIGVHRTWLPLLLQLRQLACRCASSSTARS